MVASALKRFVASAEAWLKRRRRAREERRRDQSCVCVCMVSQLAVRNGTEVGQVEGKGYTRLARGRGPLGLLGRCGRGPFGRVLASCSSSTEENVIIVSCRHSHHGEHTHDEGVKVCLGPFTREISLESSLRIVYIFG